MCCVHGNAQGAGCAVGLQNRTSAYSDMFHIEQKEELCRRSFVSKPHHYEEEERDSVSGEMVYLLTSFYGQRRSSVQRQKRIIDIRRWANSVQITVQLRRDHPPPTHSDNPLPCTPPMQSLIFGKLMLNFRVMARKDRIWKIWLLSKEPRYQ